MGCLYVIIYKLHLISCLKYRLNSWILNFANEFRSVIRFDPLKALKINQLQWWKLVDPYEYHRPVSNGLCETTWVCIHTSCWCNMNWMRVIISTGWNFVHYFVIIVQIIIGKMKLIFIWMVILVVIIAEFWQWRSQNII